MRKATILIIVAAFFILLPVISVSAQTKSKTKKKIVTLVLPTSPPKIEEEVWREFSDGESQLRVFFPKAPDVTIKGEYEHVGAEKLPCEVRTMAAYINANFYLVNIRRYPQGFLAKRDDLAQNFGAWLKAYILRGVEVKSETLRSYGRYKMVEFVYQQTSGEVVLHRAVVIGDRLYQLMLQLNVPKSLTPEQAIEKNHDRIGRFFDSFQVIEETVTDRTVGGFIRMRYRSDDL